MLKVLTIVLLGLQSAFAMDLSKVVSHVSNEFLNETTIQASIQRIEWKVGDTADYEIRIASFAGTMKSNVREMTDDRVWVEQNTNIAGQAQKVEIEFDRNTHEVLQIIVNGEQQQLPDNSSQEVLENRRESVTVKAGTFESVYAKIKNTSDNRIVEVWVNPTVIPITGMIKQTAESQFGPIAVELVSFNKQ